MARPTLHDKPLLKKSVTVKEDHLDYLTSKYGSLSAGLRACVELVIQLEATLNPESDRSHLTLDPAESAG